MGLGWDASDAWLASSSMVWRALIRTWDRTDWLIAAMDPALGRALTAMHRDPARRWTVADRRWTLTASQ